MNRPSLAVLLASALIPAASLPGQQARWFPPTPRSGLVDEVGALSDEDATQLRGLLREAVGRDDVRLVVLILKETPPLPPDELIKTVLSRQKRCWLRGLICLSADSTAPPVVGCDGPGVAQFPSQRLERALATVRDNASNETELGARVLRYTADLLDEIHQLRLSHRSSSMTWGGLAAAWVAGHPIWAGASAAAALALVIAGWRAWRRRPFGLRFPALPVAARLGGPYTGGSRVAVDFDAATIARSRERARR